MPTTKNKSRKDSNREGLLRKMMSGFFYFIVGIACCGLLDFSGVAVVVVADAGDGAKQYCTLKCKFKDLVNVKQCWVSLLGESFAEFCSYRTDTFLPPAF